MTILLSFPNNLEKGRIATPRGSRCQLSRLMSLPSKVPLIFMDLGLYTGLDSFFPYFNCLLYCILLYCVTCYHFVVK